MAQAALTRPIWLNACGKLPIISPLPGSTSSASRPTSLMAATARSKVAVAWSSSPASACACASQNALPHAIGAQASQPGRQVVALSGDGGLAMLLGELITLRQQHLPVKVVVFNNGALAFVELEMKAAVFVNYGTDLDNPDFAGIARAIGLFGATVEEADELEGALRAAFAHDGP